MNDKDISKLNEDAFDDILLDLADTPPPPEIRDALTPWRTAMSRIVWGIVQVVLMGLSGSGFTMSAFIAGSFGNAIPGIILQLVLVPLIIMALEKAGLILRD